MRNRKVLIFVENLSVPFDRRVWLEARALNESGRDVSVICPRFKNEKSREVLEGVNIYRYPDPPATKGIFSYFAEFSYCFIATFLLSFVVWARHGFDVIHACNPPDTFFVIGLFYRIFGKRFYYDQHDLCPEVYLSKYGKKKKDIIYKILLMLEFLTYKTADKVIVTNESYRQTAISRGCLRDDKIFTVRTSPELDKFKTVSFDPGIKRGKRYMVSYLGVMGPQDGVDYFLRAIDFAVKKLKREDIMFALIGSGDSLNDLKRMKEDMGLDGSVFFTGRVSDDELLKYLSASDVCVAPDPRNPLNEKSTMNKILEYMAMKKPIVSFDLKEARYSAGEAALYVTPNDTEEFARKIIFLLENETLRRDMGERGRKRLSEGDLSWEHNKNILINAYAKN